MKIIPYGRQSIDETDVDAVCEALRSDWLTQGPKIGEFERALCRLTGAGHCVAVSNGTMALHLACLALGMGEGDIGLTSPLSFVASANCVAYCGGKPDFADIDPLRLCLSPKKVEEYCLRNRVPKVVIPVDFAGVPADLPALKTLSEEYGFHLIEDAAHALGSTYICQGREYHCGGCAHTDLAIFSFHPVKTITTGEGGAVLTNREDLAEKLRRLVTHGIEKKHDHGSWPPWYYEMVELGYNGRITDIQCALGLSQLKRLGEFKRRRQAIVRTYNGAFGGLEKKGMVILPPWPMETDPCYHLYPLRLGTNAPLDRDTFFKDLREKGIHCQVHYIPIYRQPFYRGYKYDFSVFKETEDYFSTCLSLPLFPSLSDGDINYVIDATYRLLGQ